MCEIIKHFSDETSSGEYQRELTKLFRVDFAARVSLTSDFEWYRVLEQELKEKYNDELKSGLLIELASQDTNLWDRILYNIHNATIIIIDLAQHLRIYLQEINQSSATFIARISSKDLPDDYRKHILNSFREMCFHESSIPNVERMMNKAYGSMKLYDNHNELISKERLLSLGQKEFNELVARFSVALGDALDPALEEQIIRDIFEAQRMYSDGLEAYYLLSHVLKPEITYDTGTKAAFKELQNTQDKIINALEKSCWYDGSLKPGTLKQIEDSKKVTGVKIADIAAGFARCIFEHNYPDTKKASNVVRKYFSRVLLNTEWL